MAEISNEHILLFQSLFKGRTDVYAKRWEGSNSTGYSPVRIEGEYETLNLDIIKDHLSGLYTVGIYPLLKDNTSYFIAVDFDKGNWQIEAISFMNGCILRNIPCYLERSRSGNGGTCMDLF